jgi:hypothetical protein
MNLDGIDKRRSDELAIALLEWLKETNTLNNFIYYLDKYKRIDPIINEGNVSYPVELREGYFVKKKLKEIAQTKGIPFEFKDWKKKVNLALIYNAGDMVTVSH